MTEVVGPIYFGVPAEAALPIFTETLRWITPVSFTGRNRMISVWWQATEVTATNLLGALR